MKNVKQDNHIVSNSRELCRQFNNISFYDENSYNNWLREMFNINDTQKIIIRPPFMCNDGKLIHFAGDAYVNSFCSIEHRVDIYFGKDVRIGPSVTFTTTNHAIDPDARIIGEATSQSIWIGNNVWIGTNSVILPGVHIGDNSVIGAGSVVTKDIPPNVVAFGNPCRVQRSVFENKKG